MNRDRWVRLVLVTSLGISSGCGLSAQAVQFANGATAFAHPPSLVKASATQNTAYFLGSTYYFTLNLPQDAGEPLQKVVIAPQDSPDNVRFDLSNTEAFVGTPDRTGAPIPLQTVTQDPQTGAITVPLSQRVAPGQTVTIGLYAIRNPNGGGIYLYGVTAFPVGNQARSQFLGYGRIHIYDSGPDSSLNLLERNQQSG